MVSGSICCSSRALGGLLFANKMKQIAHQSLKTTGGDFIYDSYRGQRYVINACVRARGFHLPRTTDE